MSAYTWCDGTTSGVPVGDSACGTSGGAEVGGSYLLSSILACALILENCSSGKQEVNSKTECTLEGNPSYLCYHLPLYLCSGKESKYMYIYTTTE